MSKKDMVSFETLTELAKKMMAKRDRAKQHLADLEKELDALTITLRLLRANKLAPEAELSFVNVPASELKGKKLEDALVFIAERNGNTLRVRYAKKALIEALVVSEKNAAASIYTAIARSERWEKIDSGFYKLLPVETTGSPSINKANASDDDDWDIFNGEPQETKQQVLTIGEERVARSR